MQETCIIFTCSCLVCQLEQLHKSQWWIGTLHSLPLGPHLVWLVDVIVITINGVTRYILLAICCFTKYIFLHVLDRKMASKLAVFLADFIACFGIMQVIRVDKGAEFEGEFAALFEQHGIQHDIQLPYHSRGNG